MLCRLLCFLAALCLAAARTPDEVLRWTCLDVEQWMNFTIGYPEYSVYVRKHVIDGPTLLYMRPADFEDAFPITHTVHLTKLKAHIELLRGTCLCPQSARDFWSYVDLHKDKVWWQGSLLLFTPRIGMLYSYFYDYESLVEMLTGSQSQELKLFFSQTEGENEALGFLATLFFWFGFLAIPNGYLAGVSLRFWSANPFVISAICIFFIREQIGEFATLLVLFREEAAWLHKLKSLWTWRTAIPIFTFVTGYFVPYLLQKVAIFVFFGHCALLGLGLLSYFKFGNETKEKKGN